MSVLPKSCVLTPLAQASQSWHRSGHQPCRWVLAQSVYLVRLIKLLTFWNSIELCCSAVILSSLGALCHLLIIPECSLCSSCCDVRREGGTLHLDLAQDSSCVETSDPTCWPCGLTYFLYSGCCLFIDLVGLETTILSTDVDNPSCTDVSISRAENLALASQSWNTTKLLPKWDECFVKLVPKSWGLLYV